MCVRGEGGGGGGGVGGVVGGGGACVRVFMLCYSFVSLFLFGGCVCGAEEEKAF